MLLTDKYNDKISSVLTCYDRILIQGVIPSWSYAQGITSYFKANGIRIFDFPDFCQPLTEMVRNNAERIAAEHGIEIEFIHKVKAFRKDDRLKEMIAKTGKSEGLIHIFSAMEGCNTYRPWHDKATGETFLKFETSKCLHYYFYFIDDVLGLCYLRVPTWCPFRLQFYMNGHNLLSSQMLKKDISYEMIDNAFVQLENPEAAGKMAQHINPEGLHKALDTFAERFCPVAKEPGLGYAWTIQQIECATDILFKKAEDLQLIYDEIIRTAIHTVKPDNIATFLGQRITYNFKKEVGTNYHQRILGTRIKHHMGSVSIKMYDKFGLVLRIESTCNNVNEFRVNREVEHRDGTTTVEKAPMKKTIYSLYQLFTIMKAANYRYLEFISTFDDHSDGQKKLLETTKPVRLKERSYRGLNFFDEKDLKVLEIISRGEFVAYGMQNKDIRTHMDELSSAAMSRIFKRLSLHGLIERVEGSYKYFLTALGKSVIAASLTIKNLILIPGLS